MDMTIHNGRRWNTAAAYLRPALDRPNLEVRTCELVSRVMVENNRATGVAILKGASDSEEVIPCDGEVILSSGAINTPQVCLCVCVLPVWLLL
jgi:choline dehydrogenase